MPRRVAAPLAVLLAGLAAAADIPVEAGTALSRQPAAERTAAAKSLWGSVPQVAWPAGRLTLAQAIAALSAEGEPTVLADGVDGSREVDLGDGGEYWHAVLALCEAADLDLLPGASSTSGNDAMRFVMMNGGEGAPVQVAGGPVVLAPRDPARPRPLRVACGAALVEATSIALNQRIGEQPRRWLDVAVRVRLAPRLGAESLGNCSLTWSVDGPDQGSIVRRDLAGGDVAHLAIEDPDAHGRGGAPLRLTGTLTVAVVEPLALRVALQPGDRASIATPSGDVALRLLDADQAKAEDRQSPGVLLDYPTEALAREPQISVTVGGKPANTRGSSAKSGGARSERMLYVGELAAAEHQIAIDTALPIAVLALPVHLDVDLSALPSGDATVAATYDHPTPVAWDAGERTLAEAVKLLDADGNDVVLELGVNERKRAALPAFSGCFWDAAAAISRAYDLAIEPVQPADAHDDAGARAQVVRRFNGRRMIMRNNRWMARQIQMEQAQGAGATLIACGALRLGPRDETTSPPQVSGLVLAEATNVCATTTRALDGVHRAVRASVSLRLEPRITREMVADASIIWASEAHDQDGRALAVRAGGDEADNGQPSAVGLTVDVADLAPTSRQAQLRGLLRLDLRRQVRHDLRMAAGETRVVTVGADSVTVTLLSGGADGRPGLKLVGGAALDELEVTVRESDGSVKNSNNRSSTRMNGQTQEQIWYFDHLGEGQHRVELVSHEALASPCLPIAVTLDVPVERP